MKRIHYRKLPSLPHVPWLVHTHTHALTHIHIETENENTCGFIKQRTSLAVTGESIAVNGTNEERTQKQGEPEGDSRA